MHVRVSARVPPRQFSMREYLLLLVLFVLEVLPHTKSAWWYKVVKKMVNSVAAVGQPRQELELVYGGRFLKLGGHARVSTLWSVYGSLLFIMSESLCHFKYLLFLP
ncbi:hypothetical protein I7I53_08602 [Histoplasma capsulatum var. duboisii H88]|uniref:Uncharacterized protein n=1 Tax=Ajellomyces capsulatus (strain H88) TaxID=544711 RepID=A0A8A1LH56_AJEC8|nr:hypothetical protein I7I53_08602 [Histoplasma capsulatum var. duboisii H88]